MKRGIPIIVALMLISSASALIVDHSSALNFDSIDYSDLKLARENLHIVYIHTSYGTHITSGMKAIASKYGTSHAYANADNKNFLDFDDENANFGECDDLSQCDIDSNNNGYADWYKLTVDYLDYNPNTNVVLWSWDSISGHNAQLYLDTMEKMITDYPKIIFIFTTGHAQGQGEDLTRNNVHYNNELIRTHIASNNRILFDFADIESYDPDGNYYWNLSMQENLDYTGGNWAEDWIASNSESEIADLAGRVTSCDHSDSEPEMKINCALKGLAAWSLWTEVAKIIDKIEGLTCIEDWDCGVWGICIDNFESRACNDLNSCGTEIVKPTESQSCVVTQDNSTEIDSEANETIADENATAEEESDVEVIEKEDINKISLVSSNGKINFKEDVIMSDTTSIAGKVIIKHNKIYINSDALPEFNVSARLELNNITFKNPRILRNGQACPESICTLIEYNDGKLIFDVTSFSEYSSDETPVCGDDICHKEETCELCAVDCGECYQTFSNRNDSDSGSKERTEAYLTEKKGVTAIIIVFILIIFFSCILIIVKLIQQIKKRKKKIMSSGESKFEMPKLLEKTKEQKKSEKPKGSSKKINAKVQKTPAQSKESKKTGKPSTSK